MEDYDDDFRHSNFVSRTLASVARSVTRSSVRYMKRASSRP